MIPKTTRVAPGRYYVSDGTGNVTVTRMDHLPARGPQWVAAAEWDRYLYTDPLWTKADAVTEAHRMLSHVVPTQPDREDTP